MPAPTCFRVSALLSLGLLLALATGCSSDDHGPNRTGAQMNHKRKPPAPMAGQEVFFDGKIGVAIKVGALEGASDMPGEEPSEKNSGGGGGHRRGGGMGGGLNVGMGGGMGGGGGRRHGGSARDSDSEGGGRPEGVHPMLGSLEPPVMIHLQFTNHGPGRVVLNIVDFVSPLGNFAVQPETLTLDPGQSIETEPMSSQLAGSLTETDATLVLRIAGQTEKKLVVLHAVPAAPKEAGTEPAPGDLPPKDPATPPGKQAADQPLDSPRS